MKKTVDDFMRAKPCPPYTRERTGELIGDGVTPKGLARLSIPWRDILWGLIFVWMKPVQCLEFVKACVDSAKAGIFPDSQASRNVAYETEKALVVARNAIPIKDEALSRKSAWKAAEAIIDTTRASWEFTTQDLLDTALFIIGEEEENEKDS